MQYFENLTFLSKQPYTKGPGFLITELDTTIKIEGFIKNILDSFLNAI